jgi:hypothetical protein
MFLQRGLLNAFDFLRFEKSIAKEQEKSIKLSEHAFYTQPSIPHTSVHSWKITHVETVFLLFSLLNYPVHYCFAVIYLSEKRNNTYINVGCLCNDVDQTKQNHDFY